MIRRPIVAGKFYSSDFSGLDKDIRDCFSHRLGPGCTPGKRKTRKIRGIISPHAGYAYSGPCAAWGYKEIAESMFPDAYLLLGLSHAGKKSGISAADWQTPFGVVRNDRLLGEKISKATGIPISEIPHQEEHSIEVQLPFLQFSAKDNLSMLRIVPIALSGDIDQREAGRKMAEAVIGKHVVMIASSDFTHYGRQYGYVPFVDGIKEKVYGLDRNAIAKILDLDAEGFLSYLKDTGATVCGKQPITALISANQDSKPELLIYYTSADISGDYSMAVGYGALAFR